MLNLFSLPDVQPLDAGLLAVFLFLGAAVLLDLYEVSLPRGDSISVTGALCSCAIVVVGSAYGLLVTITAVIVASVVRDRPWRPRHVLALLVSRCIAWGAAAIVWALVAHQVPELVAFMFVPAAFLGVELVTSQGIASIAGVRPFVRTLRGSTVAQAPLISAEWSAAVLLLLTFRGMSVWSLVPALALLLLMRQSYALFLDIRETYRTTVEVLVEAAESQDARRIGHADRTAAVARSIAMKMGLPSPEVERISYAALLHDVGELAEASDDEAASSDRRVSSAEVVRGVEFFSRIEPVLGICCGSSERNNSEDDLLAALTVALANEIDVEYHPEVAAAHRDEILKRVALIASPALKARAVGTALRLGYRIPAVG